MSIFAQSGFGRGGKIERGYEEGCISGVILSPRDERRERLESDVAKWATELAELKILFDPQFYVTTLNTPKDGHLEEYAYYSNNMHLGRASFSGSNVRDYVSNSIDYQHEGLGGQLAGIIGPSVLFDDFRDNWSQISLTMAVESTDYVKNKSIPAPVYPSIVVSDVAFRSVNLIEEFLDSLTEIQADGFYLVVKNNSQSRPFFYENNILANIMYFIYVLSVINEYEVIVGYCDWFGVLYEAVGANLIGSGWYQNLKLFSLDRFLPSRGGRRPRKRYSSLPMVSSPLFSPELQDIYYAGFLDEVLTGSIHDHIVVNHGGTGPASTEEEWTDEIACLAHWHSLSKFSLQLEDEIDTSKKVEITRKILATSLGLYQAIISSGVSIDNSTGPNHIESFLSAISEFKNISGVSR